MKRKNFVSSSSIRRCAGILAALLLAVLSAFALADVKISKANFPDTTFREIVRQFDLDYDGKLSDAEIAAVKEIDCARENIKTLQGLEYFSSLKKLNCELNELNALDVSHNTALKELNCSGNKLTTLEVSHITVLKDLDCGHNKLTVLDISRNTALLKLNCVYNKLTALDVSHNTRLTDMACDRNQLTGLDVSHNKALEDLSCSENKLTELDLSHNPVLQVLCCSSNKLAAVDLSNNPALLGAHLNNNHLSALDISHNTELRWVCCAGNQLTGLDLSKNHKMTSVECEGNPLTILDFSECPSLVAVVKNQLRSSGRTAYDEIIGYDRSRSEEVEIYIDPSDQIIAGDYISGPIEANLDSAVIRAIPDQVYTGKKIRPEVIVTLEGKELTGGTDYVVYYSENINIGTAFVSAIGRGKYAGGVYTSFDINPPAAKITSLKAGTKALTVSWKKSRGNTGYEIQYSLKKNMKDARTVRVKKAATVKYTLPDLKPGRTYYVRVRAYKKLGPEYYQYSAWSAVRSKKTK